MPYEESAFLDGLAAGLTATAACPAGTPVKTLTTGTKRLRETWPGQFDTFVSRVYVETSCPLTIAYEYGPDENALQRVLRRVDASPETQTFYHVWQIPSAVPLTDYHYNVYLYERGDMTPNIYFDGYFMAFPYEAGGQSWTYPGKPEAVRDWQTRTYRGRGDDLTTYP